MATEPAHRAALLQPVATTRSNRFVLGALALVALLLLGRVMLPFASALLFAAVLAAALHPWLSKLTARCGGRRQLAAGALTLGVVLLLVLPVTLLTVSMGTQVVEGVSYVRETLRDQGLPGLISSLPASLRPMAEWVFDQLPRGKREIGELAQNHTGAAAAAVGDVVVATTGIVLQIAMMVVAFYFLLLDGPALVRWLADAIPLPNGQVVE